MKQPRPPCPVCESDQVVPIEYGLPDIELMEQSERGEVSLGGCIVSERSPRWKCRNCDHFWGQLGRDLGRPVRFDD